MTEEQVREKIKDEVKEAGGVRAFARLHGLSAAFISDVVRGNRRPGKTLVGAMGLKVSSREIRVEYEEA